MLPHEVTYLPMTPTLWGGLVVLVALYLVPAFAAWRQRNLGWLLVVLLLPPLGGIAWWLALVAARLRPRQPA